MIALNRTLAILIVTLTVVLGALLIVGNSPSARLLPWVSAPQTSLESELESVFGERLGRIRISGASLTIELRGEVTERELFAALVAFDDRISDAPALRVSALLSDQGWDTMAIEWDSATGVVVRFEGTGDEAMVATYPAGEQPAIAYMRERTGAIPGGVDDERLRALAAGTATPEWQ